MKQKSGLILMMVLLLMGCARTRPETPTLTPVLTKPLTHTPSWTTYTLSWQVPLSAQDLTLTLQKVEDTRCPKDVLCIWAGMALAQVQLEDSTGTSVSQILYLGEMVKFSLGTKKYQLTLREITPYPRISDLNPAQKEVRVSLAVL